MQNISFEKKLDFKDVLIVPQTSDLHSRSDVNLEVEYTFMNEIKWSGIPIIASNMSSIGVFEVYRVLKKYKMLTALHKFYTLQDYIKANDIEPLDPEYFIVSTGISDSDEKNLNEIIEFTKAKWICIDVANGYINDFINFCKKIKRKYPDKILLCGNVCTSDGVYNLLNVGVDIVKIGIGSGAACLTRQKTGVGNLQLSAILDCMEYKGDGFIASDGGIKQVGDISKAFGAGASFVMIGSLFAGHEQNPGELIQENGIQYKLFYGMSSEFAQKKHYNGMEKYKTSEGSVIKVPFKGDIINTIDDILGGIRSTATYINAKNLNEFKDKCNFILV